MQPLEEIKAQWATVLKVPNEIPEYCYQQVCAHTQLSLMPYPPIHHNHREYQQQVLEMEGLRSELTQSQSKQREEEQRYSKITLQMKVKERLKQHLGGLTDTVVSGRST